MAKPKLKSGKPTMAQRADKYKLYQESVQLPDYDVGFFTQAYEEIRGKTPLHFREDFCGTFAVSCAWVRSDSQRTAVAVDVCAEALGWGRENNMASLSKEQQGRITVLEDDARRTGTQVTDVLAVQNFSFWVFRKPAEVIEYLQAAHANLADDGVMVIDMMGGGDCYVDGMLHKTTIREGKDGFSYVWKQGSYNPINSEIRFSIGFTFPDGSKLIDIFKYRWRLWSIVEVREMLEAAGFSKSHVYWPIDEDVGPDEPVWGRREKAPSDASWICYLVAEK